MKIKIVIIFALLNFFVVVSQQSGNTHGASTKIMRDYEIKRITPPDISTFLQTKLVGVNNYTGVPNITIPLFTINQGKVTVPISLDYLATGVKVNNKSSNVGLNWSLNAGGIITKVIKGYEDFSVDIIDPLRSLFSNESHRESDSDCSFPICRGNRLLKMKDFLNPELNVNNILIDKIGWFYLEEDAIPVKDVFGFSNSLDKKFTHFRSDGGQSKDTYPDFFYVNAPGLKTSFTHKKDKTPFEIDYQGNKIVTNIGKSSEIEFKTKFKNSFYDEDHRVYFGGGKRKLNCINKIEITNFKGIQYVFDALDVNQYITRNSGYGFLNLSSAHLSSQEVTSYHLSCIKDTKGNSITFEYEKYQREGMPIKSQSFNINSRGELDLSGLQTQSEVYYPQLNRLKKITYEEGQVLFHYNHLRKDILGDKALTDIVIKDFSGEVIRRIKLEYDYFVSNTNCNSPHCLRLKLKKIVECNELGEKLPSYDFYYNETQLPEFGANSVDYLGYANSIKDDYKADRHPTTFILPNNMYYKYKKRRLSVSPIPIFRDSYEVFSKGHSLSPVLKYAQAGILTQIKKPTGAKQYFTYELNTFSTNEVKNITGAGLRLKKQLIKDEKNHIKLLEEYFYEDDKGNSSGVLHSMPTLGDMTVRSVGVDYPSAYDVKRGMSEGRLIFRSYSSSKSNFALTQGTHIGYSKVITRNGVNNGIIERNYTTPIDYPYDEAEITNIYGGGYTYLFNAFESGVGLPFLNNKEVLIGNLKNEKIKNANNDLIEEKKYTYKYKLFEHMPHFSKIRMSQFIYLSNPIEDEILEYDSKIYSHRNLQTKIESTSNFASGIIQNRIKTKFDEQYPIPTQIEKEIGRDLFSTKLFYPKNINSLTYLRGGDLLESELSAINRLKQKNRQFLIQKESYKNNQLIQIERIDYNKKLDNNEEISDVKRSKGEKLEAKVVFHSYDKKGNPTEVSKKGGAKVYYVWGYQQTQPIAKIEGYTDSQLENIKTLIDTAIVRSNSDNDRTFGDLGAEGRLRLALNSIRDDVNMKYSQVTTYTYDPLIGVTSITDPRGETVYYEYDDFNRLEYVKDAQGNILKEHKYKYKNN